MREKQITCVVNVVNFNILVAKLSRLKVVRLFRSVHRYNQS